jgi:dimethylhistidine N-methyltransferase
MKATRGRDAAAAETHDAFAADVQYYLRQDPRQLPSRYFYDALGSALFEAICRLPWYPLTRAELRLLRTHAREILDDRISTIVELGTGSGDKLAALIAASGRHRAVDVHLVDVSPSALRQARRTLEASGPVRVEAHEATYEGGLEEFTVSRGPGRALLLFLGSNIGNFDPPSREAFVRDVRMALRTGDTVLVGADLVKPEARLLLAYDDPLGVTAAFNRNLLVRINRELDADFDLNGFAHRAVWNAPESRVEMHLVSRRSQRVEVAAADLDFSMPAGESIWTESSYKHDPEEIRSMLERCGFHVTKQWIDAADRFALTRAVCT